MNNLKFDLQQPDKDWAILSLVYHSNIKFEKLFLCSGKKILSEWPYFILEYNAPKNSTCPDILSLNLTPTFQSITNFNDCERFFSVFHPNRFSDGLQLEFEYIEKPPDQVNVYATLVTSNDGLLSTRTICLKRYSTDNQKIDYYANLLDKTQYCNVATVSENNDPHCMVVFFHTTRQGIYWTSSRSSQHSLNLEKNHRAFVTIFEENIKEGTIAGKALYLEGTVSVLTEIEEVNSAKILSTLKANRDCQRSRLMLETDARIFMQDSERAVYWFKPTKIWTNALDSIKDNSRLEMELSKEGLFDAEN